jgi:hypothetical protein
MKTLVGTNDFIYRETKSRIEILIIWDICQNPGQIAFMLKDILIRKIIMV